MIKKINFDDDASKLGQAYVNSTDSDWNDLANKAVKFYIAKHCSAKKLQQLRKAEDGDPIDLGELFKNMANNNMYRE